MSVRPVEEKELLREIHSGATSVELMNRKLSQLTSPADDKMIDEYVSVIAEVRRMIRDNLTDLRGIHPKKASDLTASLLRDNVLDRVQAGRDHQDSVMHEIRKMPFFRWNVNTRKVAPEGKLKRKRPKRTKKVYRKGNL